jgi:flagellar biogenesis protein FliO
MVMSGAFNLPRANRGFFITMMVAVFFIIVFTALLYKKFRWERNNDAFKELEAIEKRELTSIENNPS